jgi:hypothetical protein
MNMVNSSARSDCNCQTNVHVRIKELKRLDSLDLAVSKALKDVIEREEETHQVITVEIMTSLSNLFYQDSVPCLNEMLIWNTEIITFKSK